MQKTTTPITEKSGVESPSVNATEIRDSIVNATNTLLQSTGDGTTPEQVAFLLDGVRDLLEGLGSHDLNRAEQALIRLGSKSDRDLFHEVGNLTRKIHQSLSDFKTSLDPKITEILKTGVPDAANKLLAVIDMTEEATHKTLNILEEQSHLTEDSEREIDALSKELVSSVENPADVWLKCQTFLQNQKKRNASYRAKNTEALTAQGFQDLSGQALKKVITLVTEIEQNLVNLVKMFGVKLHDEPSVAPTPEPQQNEKLGGQDDIDDLLKDFGF